MTIVNVIVGIVRAVVGVINVILTCRSNRIQQRQEEIKKRKDSELQEQARKAVLRPRLGKMERACCRLYVNNEGHSAAWNMTVTLEGKPLAEHPAAIQGSLLPTKVGPESEISCLLGFHMQLPPRFPIQLTWSDESGRPGSYSDFLTPTA